MTIPAQYLFLGSSNIKANSLIINNTFKEVSKTQWIELEKRLVSQENLNNLDRNQLNKQLAKINRCLSTVKKAKLTQDKWIPLAIISIKENHPLINTLIKMGMDLTTPVDKVFNLAFIDYIALYSFNEKLFQYLQQPRFTSSNVFGLTPAHYAALAYTPAPFVVKNNKNKKRKAPREKKPAKTRKRKRIY